MNYINYTNYINTILFLNFNKDKQSEPEESKTKDISLLSCYQQSNKFYKTKITRKIRYSELSILTLKRESSDKAVEIIRSYSCVQTLIKEKNK